MHSGPYDVGETTRNGLAPQNSRLESPDPAASQEAARNRNSNSLSNGSMMKGTPLAVWAQNLSIEDLENVVQ